MSRKKGVVFSAEQKTKIVLEILKEEQTIAQLASKYGVTSKSLHNWKAQFLENASLAFEPAKVVSEYKEQIKVKEEQIDELHKQLGKATIRAEFAEKKLKSLDLSNKRLLIESKHKELSIQEQCDILGLNRASVYYKPKPISNGHIKILNTISEIYTNDSDYGYRQIHKQLTKDLGYKIGKERVLKYMRLLNIKAIYPKPKRLTSIKDKEHKVYPYLLKDYWSYKPDYTKSVYVPKANEVWSSDITYIKVNGGFMYLAAVIDWHSKAILSHKISNTMDSSLACEVLQDAIAKYGRPKIFNTDQGSQYTSYAHTQILKDNDIQISMNGKGRSIDNIAIERFFRTLKYGNIYISDYQSIKELKQGVSEYIHKYNHKRFHSAIGYKRPMSYYMELTQKASLEQTEFVSQAA
jgi:putative transposase